MKTAKDILEIYNLQNEKLFGRNEEEIELIQLVEEVQGICNNEYEEKLRWVSVEERMPEFDNTKYPNGDFEKYEVKFCTGGMSPKYFIQISHLIREDKFSGEFDWTHATHWRPIEYK